MHEIGFGAAEIPSLWRITVMSEMHVLTPEGLEQTIFSPGVIGRSDAFTGVVGPTSSSPECVGARSGCEPDDGRSQNSGERHQPLPESAEERVSRSTVRAASWRRVSSSISYSCSSRILVLVSSRSSCC